MMQKREVPKEKVEEVKKLVSIIKAYKCIGFVNVEKVPANSLHKMRATLRGQVLMRMSKKRLYIRALEASGITGITQMSEFIHGNSALIATNMNPFELFQLLKSKAVKGPAKGGDIAPEDIIVKAGDTKLAPGPIISELNQHLKLPTNIKGTVHVREDTITHHKGDVINDKQAQLLARLGITPMTIMLDFYIAFENGEIIPRAILETDFEKLLSEVASAHQMAVSLAMELGLISKETIEPLIIKAYRNMKALAMDSSIIVPELISDYFGTAMAQAKAVEISAFGLTVEAPESSTTAASTSESKKEPPKDEDVGIGGLFD